MSKLFVRLPLYLGGERYRYEEASLDDVAAALPVGYRLQAWQPCGVCFNTGQGPSCSHCNNQGGTWRAVVPGRRPFDMERAQVTLKRLLKERPVNREVVDALKAEMRKAQEWNTSEDS